MNQTKQSKEARSFYLIGHRCNTLSKIDKALKQKVNGIECDLWADDEKKWWISHDGIQKTDLVEWLTYVDKAERKFRRQFSLIVFDIKSAEPIKELRDIINDHLPKGLSRLYSTATIDKAHIFSDIVSLLHRNEVIAIDEEDDPKEVAAFFQKIGATQCWYGNGITLIPLDGQFHDSMQEAAGMRDSSGPFAKVYTWSIHHRKAMYKYICEDKVDGMLVGLNGILTRPVSKALKIICATNEVQLADRNTRLF